jgi:hypothetical protein
VVGVSRDDGTGKTSHFGAGYRRWASRGGLWPRGSCGLRYTFISSSKSRFLLGEEGVTRAQGGRHVNMA